VYWIEKMTEHNLSVPDDAPWLNLSKEEISELRNKKFELAQYAKQKFKKLKEKQNKENTDK
jgi:hypothetical protein